jgi:hypothetical protein
MMQILSLTQIRRDGGTQTRALLDLDTVDEYAEKMECGEAFPPVTVFFDGAVYWLADGFHRVQGAENCDLKQIECDVRQGSQRDAILYSVGANAAHGLKRTNADKRRAVETLLNDSEWGQWSNRKIAQVCAVDESTVRVYRESICGIPADSPRKVERNGTVYTQKRQTKTETTSETSEFADADNQDEQDEGGAGISENPAPEAPPFEREEPEVVLERFVRLWSALNPVEKKLIREWLEVHG